MSSKNTNPDPLARLRDSVKATLAAIARVVDAVSAVHAAYDKTDSEKKSAEAAIQAWYRPEKQAPKPEPKKQAPKPEPVKKPEPKKPTKKPEPKKPTKKPEPKKPAKKPEPKKQTEKPETKATPVTQQRRLPASVHIGAHEVSLNLGSFMVKELAEVDARDLLNNAAVFWYRPIQFPDPRRARVQPVVEAAKVVKREGAQFDRAPWTVHVTLGISGADKDCAAWAQGVYNKNKGDQE